MSRNIGVVVRGIRGPIVRQGDDLVKIVVDSLSSAVESDKIILKNNDIIGVTEAVVAKAQNNYATIENIGEDIHNKFGNEVGIVFPITSRNRFSVVLKGISKGVDKLFIQLSYPSDEVGNYLISQDALDESNVNPHSDILTEDEFTRIFGKTYHQWTDVDYIELYKSMTDGKAVFIFSNDPKAILKYTKNVLAADIHTRFRTKKILKNSGAEIVYGLDEILSSPVSGSGYNPDYGLLGSNLSGENKLKLFPRDCNKFVSDVKNEIDKKFNIDSNVLIYGDGAFKDPSAKIWELADPVVSPGYTKGLEGTPNEIKLKYVADTTLAGLSKEDAEKELVNLINSKPDTNKTQVSQGTTPRRIVDLIGSLCDLTTGSGDKGTPFVLVQGYFDNYAND